MKPIDYPDLLVHSIYEGKGKYEGMLGGVRVHFNNNTDNGVGGGFSDKQRQLFWDHPELIIGKVIETEIMELTDAGNLRHARFKGVREDKS